MWPIPHISNNHVSITLDPNYLTCSWISQNKKLPQPFELKAYAAFPLDCGEYLQQIFNPTSIKTHITSFLKENNIKNPSIAVSVAGPYIIEKLLHIPMA